MEFIEQTLGQAVSQVQLQRTAGFIAFWTVIEVLAKYYAPEQVGGVEGRKKFSSRIVALVHSVFACVWCLYIMWVDHEEHAKISADPMYGHSDSVSMLFAHSAGYFIWDIVSVLRKEELDKGFIAHAICCSLCYVFGQYPYLQYFGIRFLLFEMSTPFLNIMMLLRQLGHIESRYHTWSKNMFGYTFLSVRIFFGFPTSYSFLSEAFPLLWSNTHHSTLVVVYYIFANLALNFLNVFWLMSILRMKGAKEKKKLVGLCN
mmetsp:Transcript_12023/g.19111  ORF Transcript_12023/g.19111 Transcript_12023/m.19111 type:complete len:259 (+) Transcript_12023:316-1092(+)